MVKGLVFIIVIFFPGLAILAFQILPSCSLLEALDKRSLFINSALANLGGTLIDQLLDNGVMMIGGIFLIY